MCASSVSPRIVADISVQQEVLLSDWKRFYARLDGSLPCNSIICSYAAGNNFHASLDGSVQQEMLLWSWKQFYACLDRSVQQEILLCAWKQFYASLDGSVRLKCSYAAENNFTRVLTDLCN